MRTVLELLGPSAWYGLSRIELAPRPHRERGVLLGAYEPSRVLIFEQPPSPWRLARRPRGRELERLLRAGARVEPLDGSGVLVEWPGETLREFFLRDVLLHELGHHVLQHERRKPRVRIARTRDHETFADAFAERCRRLLHAGRAL